MAYSQDNRLISIDTPLGTDVLLLQGMTGVEGISRLFTYNLTLLSQNPSISFSALVGRRVTISIKKPGHAIRYVNGFVSRFAQAGTIGISPTISRNRALAMVSHAKRRLPYFKKMTPPDIIKQVFQNRGFTILRIGFKVISNARVLLQYRETDFDFVSRLMEQYESLLF